MTFGFVFPYSLLKLQTRKQLEYLRKNAAYSTQGGFLLQLRLFWSNSIYAKEGSAFIHFSKANLDKLVACYVSYLLTAICWAAWYSSYVPLKLRRPGGVSVAGPPASAFFA